jgi:hypothetical protein
MLITNVEDKKVALSPQKSKSGVKTAKNYFKKLKIQFLFDIPRKNVK